MSKILFSPIGGTDPIKYLRDGSMLHICRWYRPDVVYLYLSQEMMAFHKKDNRYVASLEKLGEFLNHTFEVKIIERADLVEVQQYDVFYQDFRQEIRKIEEEMSAGDELIINMASGTPAMKSALLVMATLAEYRFKPIQVSSPLKAINAEHDDRDEFDVDENWDNNMDNLEGEPNRCEEVECLNLMKLLKIDMIKKHIRAYDYPAALAVAKELQEDISPEALRLLEIADARVKLNRKEITKLMADKKYPIFPIQDGDKQKVFEYALVLQMKVIKEEYADFIRGVTPIVVDLMESILKTECKIELADLCDLRNKSTLFWNLDKLKKANLLDFLNKEYAGMGGFKSGQVYSHTISKLIINKSKNQVLIDKIKDIIKVEQKVRNVAAHDIVSVTDEWFVEKTGKSAQEIFALIKFITKASGIKVKEEDWKSYDVMNDMIEKELV